MSRTRDAFIPYKLNSENLLTPNEQALVAELTAKHKRPFNARDPDDVARLRSGEWPGN